MDDAIKSLIVLFGFPGYGKGFDRKTCAASVQAMLQSNDSAAISVSQSPLFFFTNASGLLQNDFNNPQLTQYGCNQFCGSKMGLYSNTPIRLLTWFIPAILLVTNMQFEPSEKSELFAIMHLFGNPMNFIWMFLVKVEEWSHCRRLADELFQHRETTYPDEEEISVLDMATVLSAIRELAPESSDHFHLNKTIHCPGVQAGLRSLYKELATDIIDSKIHGTFRTMFSIILFIFGMISSFFAALGGSKTPSSTILFPAIFISWMLPAILLNNVVGQFKSSRDCLRIVSKLDEEILLRQGPHLGSCYLQIGDEICNPWMKYIEAKDFYAFFRTQSWRCGTSSSLHRSSYPLINHQGIDNRLACFAFLPVALSCALAFFIQYSYPTNFSCRHYIIIFAFFAWLISPIINTVIIRIHQKNQRARFIFIVFKDSVIGIVVIGLLVASTCGLFNNCWCWSGINVKGHPVVLNPAAQFAANDGKIYPGTVGAVLCMQLCFFFVMCWQGRKGLRIMSRSSKEKRNALPEALTSRVQILDRRQISDSNVEMRISVKMHTNDTKGNCVV